MGFPFSITGSQPNRISPSRNRPIPSRLRGERPQGIELEDELFVFGADPPCIARLVAFFKILDQLPIVGNRFGFTAGGAAIRVRPLIIQCADRYRLVNPGRKAGPCHNIRGLMTSRQDGFASTLAPPPPRYPPA